MASPHLYFAGDRLSQAELTAACLDGHLVAVDEAFIPADAVETPALRAASLHPLLGEALAATHLSAAWIHGALCAPPARHRAQRVCARRLHHIIDRRLDYRDRRLPPGDLMVVGGVAVTVPDRTLADLARVPDADHEHAARMMASTGIADVAAAIARLTASGPLQNKRVALALLEEIAAAQPADQPEVTR